jgi:anaerobic magnesium-protoporphyrin IX monomethyl ester cyclase
MQRILIHPPFADPTQPYISLPTLKAYLAARGLDARVVDLNLEAAHYFFRRDTIEKIGAELSKRIAELGRARGSDVGSGLSLEEALAARRALDDLATASVSPVDVFRDSELFYDPAAYEIARRQSDALFRALDAAWHPYVHHFRAAHHSVRPWSFDLLDEYTSERRSPLDGFYREVLDPPSDWKELERRSIDIDLETADFVGVSVIFPSQILEAFYLCRLVKERRPDIFVALGGPCVHQAVLHMDERVQARLFDFCDGVGIFEGEATLAALFPRLDAWRATRDEDERRRILADVPNLLAPTGEGGAVRRGPGFLLDLRETPPPDYSDLDLDRYLAPSRVILYSPTRGCYWDKCSFCYYGLSESATAKYREIPPERAASDLARLSQRYGTRNFYLSCDVLSPSYAVRFAEALVERGLRIRWSSDLKIDKYFTPERCELLARSGLRSAAFGIESGSDRILDLMRKGCDRETMTRVNRSFHEAGVATEWMTFTGHPGEGLDEALQTVDWIEQERDAVDLFIVGKFTLQPGSDIAKQPDRYGVDQFGFAPNDDFRLWANWTQKNRIPDADTEELEAAVDELAQGYALSHYPWAGAISTHHSFLYFLRFGQRAFCRDRGPTAALSPRRGRRRRR